MQPEYEMVMDTSGLLSAAGPVTLHTLSFVAQLLFAAYLLVHGAALLLRGGADSPFLRKLGAPQAAVPSPALLGGLLCSAGALLLLPTLTGRGWFLSLLAAIAAIGLLLRSGGLAAGTGQLARRLAFGCGAFTLLFGAWERDDPASLTLRIAQKTLAWRQHEIDWQLTNDRNSPKVGDLAPDFELQDPSGEKSVRLSSFFGKRPVALTFGSYT